MNIFHRTNWKEELILEAVKHPKEAIIGIAVAAGAALLYLALPDSVSEYISDNWLNE